MKKVPPSKNLCVSASLREPKKAETKPALVPKLRFPEFRKTAGWKERPLGDFLSESRLPGSKGNVAKKITVKLWGNGVFEKNDAIQGSINTQYFRRKAGQFIYSKLDFLNQAFGIIPPSLDNFESTVDLPCFDFADGLNSVFLLEYVKRRDFYERLGETADGSRKARRIHAETFLSFPIALPSPAEQQKIAECLSSVDELIAAQARKLDALKTHKKGLMQQLFPREGETQPRLRFPEFQNDGKWEVRTIGEMFSLINGCAFKPEDWKSTGTPIIRIQNLNDPSAEFNYSQAPVPERNRVESGDLLFAWSGTLGSSFGARIWKGPSGVLNQHIFKVLMDEQQITLQFALLVLARVEEEIARRTHGFKASFVHVKKSDLVKVEMLLPSLPEQQRIADCLSSLDDLIAAQTQTLEALKTQKQGLMQQLFPSPEEVES
ncbi:MAG: restriction endonuclease subunit S [Opitutaceae bacterium]